MKDNRTEILEDEFADAALNLMLDEYAGESGAQLLAEYERSVHSGIPVTDHDDICRKEIQRFFRKKRLHHAAIHYTKAAAVSIVFLGLMFTTVLSVEAIRVPILNFFLVRFPGYTQVTTVPESSCQPAAFFEELNENRSSFAPDGYTLSQAEYSAAYFTALYTNPSKHTVSISAYDSNGNLAVDSEDCTETRLTINGLDAVYWKKNTGSSRSLLLMLPEKNAVAYLYAGNMSETDFWQFVYCFASYL